MKFMKPTILTLYTVLVLLAVGFIIYGQGRRRGYEAGSRIQEKAMCAESFGRDKTIQDTLSTLKIMNWCGKYL
jgi:cbb3-type cytochrome oxidase subunit 3